MLAHEIKSTASITKRGVHDFSLHRDEFLPVEAELAPGKIYYQFTEFGEGNPSL